MGLGRAAKPSAYHSKDQRKLLHLTHSQGNPSAGLGPSKRLPCIILLLERKPVCLPVKINQMPVWGERCQPDRYKPTAAAAFPDGPYQFARASLLFPLFQPR